MHTCPACYFSLAVATVLIAAAYVAVRDARASRTPRRRYRPNIKLPRTRAEDPCPTRSPPPPSPPMVSR